MDHFIVRIYRRDGKKILRMVGLVERIGNKKQATEAFHNPNELWAILGRRSRPRPSQRKPPKRRLK